jgi:hypothetical protein
MIVIHTSPEVEMLGSMSSASIEGFSADKYAIMLQALLDVAWFTINDNLASDDIVSYVKGLIHESWFLTIDVNVLYSLSTLMTDTMLWLTEVIVKYGLVMNNMIVKYTPGFITLQ